MQVKMVRLKSIEELNAAGYQAYKNPEMPKDFILQNGSAACAIPNFYFNTVVPLDLLQAYKKDFVEQFPAAFEEEFRCAFEEVKE